MNHLIQFFDRNPHPSLPLFSPEHLATLFLTLLSVICLILFAKKIRDSKWDTLIRIGLLSLLLTEQIARLSYRVFTNSQFNPAVDLPLQLCHFAALFSILYLLTLNRQLFSIVAFWGIIGCLALLIPAFQNHFPHIEIWIFFLGHLGMLATVTYGFFVRQIKLNSCDLLIILIVSLIALLIVPFINRHWSANYFYLAFPPPALAKLPYWLYLSGLGLVYWGLIWLIYALFRQNNNTVTCRQ